MFGIRRTPMKPSRGTVWPREVRTAIVERDEGHCVCARAGFPLEVIRACPVYPVDLDHVRASGAIGRKSRSTVDNGVCLSRPCHDWKGRNGRIARPLLIDYIEGRSVIDCLHVDVVSQCPSCLARSRSA